MDDWNDKILKRIGSLLDQLDKLEQDIMHLRNGGRPCSRFVDCKQGAEHAGTVAWYAIKLAAELTILADEIKYAGR